MFGLILGMIAGLTKAERDPTMLPRFLLALPELLSDFLPDIEAGVAAVAGEVTAEMAGLEATERGCSAGIVALAGRDSDCFRALRRGVASADTTGVLVMIRSRTGRCGRSALAAGGRAKSSNIAESSLMRGRGCTELGVVDGPMGWAS